MIDRIKVGDPVTITGTATRIEPGVGVLVKLTSKTDQYEAWICEDHVHLDTSEVTRVPSEPDSGTWLIGDADWHGNSSVFHRDDAEGHADEKRRYDEHWWDVAASEWVDWPTAWSRGANPTRQLVPVNPDEAPGSPQ